MQKENLGSAIKEIRQQNKMTLKNLSEDTELSISFLSQLERGKSSATLKSLKKISLALGVNPSYFFQQENTNQMDSFTTRLSENQFYYQDLSGGVDQPAFSPLLIVMKPGQSEESLMTHTGQEFIYMLEGQLTVQVNEKIHTLNPNESIMFDSTDPHYWYNYSNEDVRFLCISYDQ
ncbi:helix-turn-helix transcriptional regulator [Sporosarcina sp. Marseille-Q4063]|uniref:helix-turn-helix domain-containing protein n=1 Tax=Sporosarcina sp. Marseille-Q4063 TaxID=2810514 RepID=UPI001BB03787|nr:XRE family transcriptional regulator [Sporosarcina sp. Marseille-Q4063]QUW23153.1 helix-turn-helix transcriptional regulator [Sporosarcina sp. Marseille-Q4063]